MPRNLIRCVTPISAVNDYSVSDARSDREALIHHVQSIRRQQRRGPIVLILSVFDGKL
jgi:hypothetical protein